MGRIKKGANGGFSGKAGSVVGSSWKGIDYIRGLSKKSNKPPSEDQLIQQARFQLLSKFLMPISGFLNVGYGQVKADRMTPSNVALKTNMMTAITGVYPSFVLDYAKISLAQGGLQSGGNMSATAAAGVLTVSWSTGINSIMHGEADDQVQILVYHPTAAEYLTTDTITLRATGTATITVPDYLLGDKGHVWIFFNDRKQTRVSKSSYLVEIDLV